MTQVRVPAGGRISSSASGSPQRDQVETAEAENAWSFASNPLIRFRTVRIDRKVDFTFVLIRRWGQSAARFVEALCYKAEGRGFESR
jgi:hypothetical protein